MIGPRTLFLSCAVVTLGGTAAAPAAIAAQEVVQALPSEAEEELSAALRRLSRNPDSLPALIAAGRASLELGDNSAAQSFLVRAQDIAPDDGRVLAALGVVAVRRGQPATAVRLFTNAARQGHEMAPYAAERGLAYDLIGRNERAQRYYRQALAREQTPEVVRRLALSYAISGDPAASETVLLPLLQRQDRSAFRTRAFALAIAGQQEEAISIAETMLPARLATRLQPYLEYMPRLTRAQQAAAANLGEFPAANEVGRDRQEIATLAASIAQADASETGGPAASVPTAPVPAAQRLEPQGTPMGPAVAASTATELPVVAQAPATATTTEPTRELPAIGTVASTAADVVAGPPVAATARPSDTPPATQPVATEPEPVFAASAAVVQATPQAVVQPSAPSAPPPSEARPSFTLIEPGPSTEATPEEVELAEAFADFALENLSTAPAAGAVDITAFEPPREVDEPQPQAPPPPAHPARSWVQVATGRDASAFRFDWRRIRRAADGVLDGVDAFTAPWGETNRLLAGPFPSSTAAQAAVGELAEAGVDAFRFESEDGQEITPLD